MTYIFQVRSSIKQTERNLNNWVSFLELSSFLSTAPQERRKRRAFSVQPKNSETLEKGEMIWNFCGKFPENQKIV